MESCLGHVLGDINLLAHVDMVFQDGGDHQWAIDETWAAVCLAQEMVHFTDSQDISQSTTIVSWIPGFRLHLVNEFRIDK